MTNVIWCVKRVQHDEGVLEWALAAVFAKLYCVSIQVEQMGLESNTVKVEEAW